MASPSTLRWGGWVLAWSFKLVFAAVCVAVPLLGVWIASSLAALHDGPLWASLLGGALCFPLLPLLWEGWATWRRRRRANPRAPILTGFDRILLRTLGINLVFVGGLLAAFPTTVFAALSSHGDWMLRRWEGPWVDQTRGALFRAAESMEWLHEWTHPNEFEELVDEAYAPPSGGTDEPEAGQTLQEVIEDQQRRPEVAAQSLRSHDHWPFVDEVHPLVRALPAEAEGSIASVAAYIVAREDDPLQRVKALHDYVADRIAYDAASLRAGRYPPQDAPTVFQTRLGVCAGYANLLAALGEAAGVEIVVVVGDARDFDDNPWGSGHAWNAFSIDGRWYLMDATWDAGHVGAEFERKYRAAYFMTPPEVFGISHFPEDPKWQLVREPVDRGEFLRRPDVRPTFYAFGFDIESPRNARVEASVGGAVDVEIASEFGLEPSATVFSGEKQIDWCETKPLADGWTLRCPMPSLAGRYEVALFGPEPEDDFMGQIYVDVR